MLSRPHLSLLALHLGGDTLVALVLVAGAQPADVHLARATVELLQVLVLRADLLGQLARGGDELVLLQLLLRVVGLQAGLTVRAHARQAALHRRPPRSPADVAGHRRGGQLRPGGLG